MASPKLTIGIGAVVVLGFVVIIGMAAWSHYGHHGDMHESMHGEAPMHDDEVDGHHAEVVGQETMPEDSKTSGQGHTEAGEMGEHHDTNEHHGMDKETIDTSKLEPTGTLQNDVRVINMKARQFEFSPSTVVVKQGETVRLNVTSEDVTHGIDIEGFDIDKRLPPKETVTIEFTANKSGQHHFHCSVFCGKRHGEMHGRLVVLTQTENDQQ